MGKRTNPKKHFICIVVLLSVFLFLSCKGFAESTPRTILLGESQHFDLPSPVVIPFASTQEIINEMRQKTVIN